MAKKKKVQMTEEERLQKEQEIRNLICGLQTSISESVGDYQMIRFLDKVFTSDKFWNDYGDLQLPKTREEITAIVEQRDAKRARIQELQKELGE